MTNREYAAMMEQRRYFRVHLGGTEVHISDRAGFCTGTLKDCSRFGLCIGDLPRKIHSKDGSFTVSVADPHKNFKLHVEEKWRRKDGLSNVVGAVIENVPWNWTEMVMLHEPGSKDVWDAEKSPSA